jgi:hypothetical protein
MALITTLAELGESHTSNFTSTLSGTSPKVVPFRHLGELVGFVRLGEDGFRDVFTHLGYVDVNPEGEFDIVDMVTTQVDVHQTWHTGIVGRIFVEFNSLDE